MTTSRIFIGLGSSSARRATRPPCDGSFSVAGRRGFTLVEMMVSIALLVAVIAMVSQVFKISSDATGRTSSQAEVFAGATAFREMVTGLVSQIEPGLLVIYSPPPTDVRAESSDGEQIYRLRHDRIAFIASGSPGQFQSYTDPTRGSPDPGLPNAMKKGPSASGQGLVYIGPAITKVGAGGMPLTENAFLADPGVLARDWVLSNRIILLGQENGTGVGNPVNDVRPEWQTAWNAWDSNKSYLDTWFPASSANVPLLPAPYLDGRMDVLYSSTNTPDSQCARTLLARVNSISAVNRFSSVNFCEMNYAPSTANMVDIASPNYYTRAGASFLSHVADLRIEWTDGRPTKSADPGHAAESFDLQTRWFGLRPDRSATPRPDLGNPTSLNSLPYSAFRRAIPRYLDGTAVVIPSTLPPHPDAAVEIAERDLFRDEIESAPSTGASASYTAVWRQETWRNRPKALRFTFRIYDDRDRLTQPSTVDLDEDGVADPEGAGPNYATVRHGQEFSFVIPLN